MTYLGRVGDRLTTWTKAHERLVDAWAGLYRTGARRRRPPHTLESWIAAKFKLPYACVADLTVAQARQARRCLRAWEYGAGFDALPLRRKTP